MLLRRCLSVLFLLALLAAALPGATPPAAAAGPAATPSFASSLFQSTWTRNDGPVAAHTVARAWLWGPTPGTVRAEPFAGAPNGVRTVQYFDKARMEVNPGVSDPANPWAVTTGLLVVELVSGQVQVGGASYEAHAPAEIPVAGDGAVPAAQAAADPTYRSFAAVASLPGGPARRAAASPGAPVVTTIDRAGTVGVGGPGGVHYASYTQATGHNVADVFAQFMQSKGPVDMGAGTQNAALFDPVYVFGYPISEAYWATVPIAGTPTPVLIQLFQRRVLTYVPSAPADWRVQMGNVGQHYETWRYGPVTDPAAPPGGGSAPPAASGLPDTFVRLSGNQFTYAGAPVRLKGTNYWLHSWPFVGTWTHWDGPTVQRELAQAQALGINTIRIGLPYDHNDALAIVWGDGCEKPPDKCDQIHGWLTNQMTQLLQIAQVYGIKVIFVLFDWSDSFPAAGTHEFQRQLNYLQGIVGPFARDDRVLAWDLHNEPENYATWNGHPDQVIDWTARVAAAVRAIDPNHPLTIGVSNYADLWAAPAGARLIDSVDFVSFHCYSAGALRTQIDDIESRTTKPILLEEMGWPTGPAAQSSPAAVYDEPTQTFLYHSMLGDAKASTLSGVVQWALQDFVPGSTTGGKGISFEEWFGLFRLDGSAKPAAAIFRDSYPVRIMPSTTATYLPLTNWPGRHP